MSEVTTGVEHSSIFRVHEPLPTISSHVFGDVGIFSIANTTTTIALITALIVLLGISMRGFKMIPSTFQHLSELLYESILSFIAQIMGTTEKAKKVIPYVGAVMLYLIIANLLPMIPFVSSFYITTSDGGHIPLFRGATTDFNTTFGLALAVVASIQYFGMKEQGVFGYLSHFIQIKQVYKGFKKSVGEGMTGIVGFLVGLIEIISEFAKIASLSLRLFGNMFAHEMLTVILLGAFAFAVPALWMGMGVIVGIVQALVFSALITVYYSLVLKKEGSDHH